MLNFIRNHALNLFLRGVTILLRFALIFGLTKYYSLEDLGAYGLFNTTITIVIFFLGFDFYSYAHREILKVEKPHQVALLANSLGFFILTYLVVLPLCLIVFFIQVLPFEYLVWFYLILIAEHFSQELYRIFLLLGNQLFANLLLFLRMAAWVIPAAAYWVVIDFKSPSLHIIFLMWFAGATCSILLGIIRLRNHYKGIPINFDIDKEWISKGIPVSARFLVGTIAYKIIEFSDRYFLDFYLDKAAVGIYTFYYNFANVLQTLVFTIVIAQLYPKLTEYFAKKDMTNFHAYRQKFAKNVTLLSIVSAGILLVLILPAIQIIQKPELYDHYTTYVILIVAVTLLNISFIPHYILYATHQDNRIMVSTIYCAIVNLICNLLLTSKFGLIGSALSTLLSYLALLIIKFYYTSRNDWKAN